MDEVPGRDGSHTVSVRLLHEFGQTKGYLNKQKIQDLWSQYSQHPVLFSDHTQGKVEPFLDVLLDASSCWVEIFSVTEDIPLGVGTFSRVYPGVQATCHVVLWDRVGSGREPLARKILEWGFERYQLRRMNAEAPEYQRGLIRFTKRVGFTQEGVRRKTVLYKDHWCSMVLFGLLSEELEERLEDDVGFSFRKGAVWNSGRNSRWN